MVTRPEHLLIETDSNFDTKFYRNNKYHFIINTMANIANNISIENARPLDANRIAQMSRDLVEHGLTWSWRPARVAWQIGRDDALVSVARAGDDIAGFALTRFMDQYVRLMLLAVGPAYQGQGIGDALVKHAWREALAAFSPTMHLEVRVTNKPAIRFYHRLGFHSLVVLPKYYDNDEDAIHMYCSIDAANI